MKDVPHRVLTRPKKAFELFFDGSRGKGRGRESVLRLETIASGRAWHILLCSPRHRMPFNTRKEGSKCVV